MLHVLPLKLIARYPLDENVFFYQVLQIACDLKNDCVSLSSLLVVGLFVCQSLANCYFFRNQSLKHPDKTSKIFSALETMKFTFLQMFF